MSKKAYKQRIYIEAEKCVECGACTAVCGAKALRLDKTTLSNNSKKTPTSIGG